MRRGLKRAAWASLFLIFALEGNAWGQTPPPVPAEYQDLYTSSQSQIANFEATIQQSWDHKKGAVGFGTHLGEANSLLGSSLLSIGHDDLVVMEIDLLKALGANTITLSIDYPILDPAFDPWGGQAAAYLSFYQTVVAELRARGLKVSIETGFLFSNTMYATNLNVLPYYNSLTTDQYSAGRAAQALLIAQTLKPDYLSVLGEPDTEADQTGKTELGTVSGSTTLLNKILTALRQPGGATMPVGAGVGSWTPSYDQYIQSFVATSIDFVDMHTYPVNKDYLTRAFTIADMAAAAGKRMAISECWFQKERDSELALYPTNSILARNNFSFWAPLDQQYLQAIVDFSYYKNLLFATPFWEGNMFAYVDYDATTSAMSSVQLMLTQWDAWAANMQSATYNSTGMAWKNMLLASADGAAPLPPVLALGVVYPNGATINWTEAPDNVGTAGYNLYRDGQLLTTMSQLNYYDNTLQDGRTYKYNAIAFDASGNISSLSASLPVSTPDRTAPTTPTNFALSMASGNQINLTWTASTDNVGVKQYAIYRGKNGAAPTGYALTTTNSFQNTSLISGSTYCYYVVAQDATLNTSAGTATLCGTSDTSAPSAPTGLAGTALSSTKVSLTWVAATDNVAVTGYQVQRTQGSTTVILGTSTATSFTDATVTGPNTYTYQVLAYDAIGNQSALSAGAAVTTPGLDRTAPSVPGSPAATAQSATQVKVTWTASTDNVGVTGYEIQRTVGTTTVTVGTATGTSFTDNAAPASTACTYRVLAYDAAGNRSALSAGATVTTPGDTTSPSTPTNVTATANSSTQVTITWTASTDNTGVTGYTVQRTQGFKTVTFTTGVTTSYTDTTASRNTSYTYKVQAFDAAGNKSFLSSGASVTTPR